MKSLIGGVLVADHGVDAALVGSPDGDDLPWLVLRPDQTFGSAVAAVQAVLPDAPVDRVRALVREQLPGAIRLDEVLPVPMDFAPAAPAPAINRFVPDPHWLPWQAWAAATVVLIALLVGFVAIHVPAQERWREFQEWKQDHLHEQVTDPPALNERALIVG